MLKRWGCLLAVLVGIAFGRGAGFTPLALGAPAPEFRLPGTDGKMHRLREFSSAKIFVVIFLSNHCRDSQACVAGLKRLVTDYRSRGVTVVAISPHAPAALRLDELGYTDVGDSLAEMKLRAEERGFNFTYLYDGDRQEATRAFGPDVTPYAFVFDAGRRLRYSGRLEAMEPGREGGGMSRPVRQAVEELLAGTSVTLPQVPALGTPIRRVEDREEIKAYLRRLAAEPVSLERVDERGLVSLRKNLGGRLRLINFWAPVCGPCVSEFPDLVEIGRIFRLRPFELVTVAVAPPRDEADVLAFLKNREAAHRNYILGSPDTYRLLAAFDPDWDRSLPYSVLLAPDGKVVYRCVGALEPRALKRAVVEALGALEAGR